MVPLDGNGDILSCCISGCKHENTSSKDTLSLHSLIYNFLSSLALCGQRLLVSHTIYIYSYSSHKSNFCRDGNVPSLKTFPDLPSLIDQEAMGHNVGPSDVNGSHYGKLPRKHFKRGKDLTSLSLFALLPFYSSCLGVL